MSVLAWFREPVLLVVHATTPEETWRVLGAVLAGQGVDMEALRQAAEQAGQGAL